MEADLHQHFHLDLVDLWRPGSGLTLRKLWVLINRMPTKSATATALNDGREPWTLAEYLASDNWVLLAKQLNDKAPDAHPRLPRPPSDLPRLPSIPSMLGMIWSAANPTLAVINKPPLRSGVGDTIGR